MISEILRLQIQKQQSRRQCNNVLMCHSDDEPNSGNKQAGYYHLGHNDLQLS